MPDNSELKKTHLAVTTRVLYITSILLLVSSRQCDAWRPARQSFMQKVHHNSFIITAW